LFLIRMILSDSVILMLDPEYTPEATEAIRRKLGLDQSLIVQ